jgi:lipoprotein-anchoring transpeptidase ErfK/SrfK
VCQESGPLGWHDRLIATDPDAQVSSRRALLARIAALLAIAAALLLHGERETDSGLELRAAAPTPAPRSLIATAKVPSLQVYGRPTAPSPNRVLANPTPTGGPLVLLVERLRGNWLLALLPVRPNGSRGWIRASDVRLDRTSYRVDVSLSRHRVRVLRGDREVLEAPIAVGTRDTPTPGGKYFLKELLRPPDPDTVYGTYAYGLSGFSSVFTSFAGGEGVIGLHGTNDPSVIGQDVSSGCIRMRNRDIKRLVPLLPLGTPVRIEG